MKDNKTKFIARLAGFSLPILYGLLTIPIVWNEGRCGGNLSVALFSCPLEVVLCLYVVIDILLIVCKKNIAWWRHVRIAAGSYKIILMGISAIASFCIIFSLDNDFVFIGDLQTDAICILTLIALDEVVQSEFGKKGKKNDVDDNA